MKKENFPIGWLVEVVGNTRSPETSEYPKLVGKRGEIIGTIPPNYFPPHRLMIRLSGDRGKDPFVNVLPVEIKLIDDEKDKSDLT